MKRALNWTKTCEHKSCDISIQMTKDTLTHKRNATTGTPLGNHVQLQMNPMRWRDSTEDKATVNVRYTTAWTKSAPQKTRTLLQAEMWTEAISNIVKHRRLRRTQIRKQRADWTQAVQNHTAKISQTKHPSYFLSEESQKDKPDERNFWD